MWIKCNGMARKIQQRYTLPGQQHQETTTIWVRTQIDPPVTYAIPRSCHPMNLNSLSTPTWPDKKQECYQPGHNNESRHHKNKPRDKRFKPVKERKRVKMSRIRAEELLI